jgi:hypothetical protein
MVGSKFGLPPAFTWSRNAARYARHAGPMLASPLLPTGDARHPELNGSFGTTPVTAGDVTWPVSKMIAGEMTADVSSVCRMLRRCSS